MSRFFKSAAFPILIVVVLAFFAQRLISPNNEANKPTFRDFNSQLDAGEIRNVDMKNKDNTVEVTLRDGKKYKVGFADDYGGILTNRLIAAQEAGKLQDFNIEGRQSNGWLSLLTLRPAVPDLHRVLDLPHEPGAGRRLEGDVVRQVARQADVGRLAEDHLPRRRGRRRGGGGAPRDQGVPGEPEEVPGARRADPEGRPALRASGHRQDPARTRRRGRGGRPVLLDLRLGLRRDVRRRGRVSRPRPVRAGEAELALHHLHGRDRRRRAPPRRRPRRRSRRA